MDGWVGGERGVDGWMDWVVGEFEVNGSCFFFLSFL